MTRSKKIPSPRLDEIRGPVIQAGTREYLVPGLARKRGFDVITALIVEIVGQVRLLLSVVEKANGLQV